MSHVLSVVLISSIIEEEEDRPDDGRYHTSPFVFVNMRLRARPDQRGWRLAPVDEHAGGSKHLQFHVWAGGLNFCTVATIKAIVAAAPWQEPQSVVVIYEDEHDESPTTWRLGE